MKQRLPTVTVVRLALAALAMGACGDAAAVFDDSYLMAGGAANVAPIAGGVGNGDGPEAPGAGGSGGVGMPSAGGTPSPGGSPALGGVSPGGSAPDAGASPGGGTESAGAPTAGGTSGGASAGGASSMGGSTAGGSAGMTGAAGVGGGAGAGGTGGAGTVVYGDPITVESQNLGDTYVIACYPQANYRMDDKLVVDSEPCQADILLKPPIANIPSNAKIKAATITLTCTNAGPGLTLFRPESDWGFDSVTWQTRPVATQFLTSLGTVSEGRLIIDVTSQVSAWVEGSLQPFGLGLRTDHHDGLIFASSRASEMKQRPKLSVTYAVPLQQ